MRAFDWSLVGSDGERRQRIVVIAVLKAEKVALGGPLEWWSVVGGWKSTGCQARGSIAMKVGIFRRYVCCSLVFGSSLEHV